MRLGINEQSNSPIDSYRLPVRITSRDEYLVESCMCTLISD